VLLGFPTDAGTMDGGVVRYRPAGLVTRRVTMPVGEPDGQVSPRLERIVRAFRTAGINAKAEPRMDAWLKTHAAFAVPLGQAVLAAGGPRALAGDPDAVRDMLRRMWQNLGALPTSPVPRGFVALRILPEGLLVAVLRRFLRSPTAAHSGLASATPAVEAAELERLAEQVRLCRGPVGDRRVRLLGRISAGHDVLSVGVAHAAMGWPGPLSSWMRTPDLSTSAHTTAEPAKIAADTQNATT